MDEDVEEVRERRRSRPTDTAEVLQAHPLTPREAEALAAEAEADRAADATRPPTDGARPPVEAPEADPILAAAAGLAVAADPPAESGT